MLDKFVQTWLAIRAANKSKRNSVTGLPLESLYCKHAGNVIIGRLSCVALTGDKEVELLFKHIWVTIACNTGTSVVGVVPAILRHFKFKPVKLGLAETPLVIKSHTLVANLEVTSLIVSPEHKAKQLISGPCHITQLEDILSHPFVVPLEFVGIINISF